MAEGTLRSVPFLQRAQLISAPREEYTPVEIEPSHQNNAVNTHLPFLPKHFLGLSPEISGSDVLVPTFLGLEELFALGEADADESDCNRDTSCSPKNSLNYDY